MGTLGCINDMLQRDKENRELRKLNRDRMKEHHKYLVGNGKNADLSNVSIEKIEEIRKKTIEKEQSDQIYMFRIYIFLTICLLVLFYWDYFAINYFSKFPQNNNLRITIL